MATIKYISECVNSLISKYRTRDPFILCGELDINVYFKELGDNLKAYYFYHSRIKSVVINSEADEHMQKVLCAHELGHAILHSQAKKLQAFCDNDLYNTRSSTEYEANIFVAELLVDKKELFSLLKERKSTVSGVAKELCVPPEMVDFKLRILNEYGCKIKAPYIAQSDFLNRRYKISK